MLLNSKQCDAFFAVAETGSFDAAAQVLNITASAVTLRVQSLEKSLGQLLIVRERPCRITQAGQALLTYLEHRKRLEQQLIQDFNTQAKSDGFYALRIATNADSLATWLLPTLASTLIDHQITLQLQVADQSQTHQLLEAGKVSACISTQSNAMNGCVAHKIGQMNYRMVATPDFNQRWFSSGFNRENIRKAPAVMYNEQDHLHSDVILQHFGLSRQCYPFHLIPSSNTFAEAILQGLGFGLVPDYQIGDCLKHGELVELLPAHPSEVTLYWHHWKQQPEALQQLTKVLIKQAAEVMN
ncbi:LysR family transcriptional regulator ArgP [Acinetobacter bouvetii]|uniref:Chromosome initiation inhibitor n=1 Tax=Acinetobacter bouvetii TaxID=202951 RepID=A0A811G8Y2_9GAMM|nr:LysR family transcriptional regulator ArgP [Acinetobacter bouvetii]CAB1211103.1 Chromosome initiation inhibitor [Acinetobacter bouvetii]